MALDVDASYLTFVAGQLPRELRGIQLDADTLRRAVKAFRHEARHEPRISRGVSRIPSDENYWVDEALPSRPDVAELDSLFDRMRDRRVLVVGDVMVDKWVFGRVVRVSPEAPVPIVLVEEDRHSPGGAGNVVNNLRALGVNVSFVGVVGGDETGRLLLQMLEDDGVDLSGVVTVPDRPTTRKTRIIASDRTLLRTDREVDTALAATDRGQVAAHVARLAGRCNAVIFSDYAKGVISKEVVEAARKCPIILGHSKPANASLFTKVNVVAATTAEIAESTSTPVVDAESLERASRALLARLGCRYVVVTQGNRGVALFGADGSHLLLPLLVNLAYDISGVGSATIATLTACLATGATIEVALQVAVRAASVVVQKVGTGRATPGEILELEAPAGI